MPQPRLTCYSNSPTLGLEKLSNARQMPRGISGFGIDGVINWNLHFICKLSSCWLEVYGKCRSFISKDVGVILFPNILFPSATFEIVYSFLGGFSRSCSDTGKQFKALCEVGTKTSQSALTWNEKQQQQQQKKQTEPVKIYRVYVENIHSPI